MGLREFFSRRYRKDISKIDLINDKEEINRLVERIQKGGQDGENARNELVEANLRFVIACVKKYTRLGVDSDDLIQEGNRALIRAAELYDPTKGAFTTYSVNWIKSYIDIFLNQNSRDDNIMKLYQEGMTVADIAETTNKTIDQVRIVIGRNTRTVSLDASFHDDKSNRQNTYEIRRTAHNDRPDNVHEIISDGQKEPFEKEDFYTELNRVFNFFPESREVNVLILFYGLELPVRQPIDTEKVAYYKKKYSEGDGMSLDDIGEIFGLGHHRINEIKKKALDRLKYGVRKRLLKEFPR